MGASPMKTCLTDGIVFSFSGSSFTSGSVAVEIEPGRMTYTAPVMEVRTWINNCGPLKIRRPG